MPDRASPALLDRAVDALGNGAAWLFAATVAITAYEVIARYAFGSPTSWAHATATALCAIAFALGGAYAQRRNEHMRVTSLVDRLSSGRKALCRWVAVICGVIYLAGLAWGTWNSAVEAVWRFEFDANNVEHWVPEPLPGPPGWPLPALIKATLFAGTVLFLAVLIARSFRRDTDRLDQDR